MAPSNTSLVPFGQIWALGFHVLLNSKRLLPPLSGIGTQHLSLSFENPLVPHYLVSSFTLPTPLEIITLLKPWTIWVEFYFLTGSWEATHADCVRKMYPKPQRIPESTCPSADNPVRGESHEKGSGMSLTSLYFDLNVWKRRQSPVGAECTRSNPVFPPSSKHGLVRTRALQQGDGRGTQISLSRGKNPTVPMLLCNASTVRILWVIKTKPMSEKWWLWYQLWLSVWSRFW